MQRLQARGPKGTMIRVGTGEEIVPEDEDEDTDEGAADEASAGT